MSERYINLKSVLLIVLFIYFYPYILTFINMGIHEIPPIFDWDLYLYLNISDLHFNQRGYIINPWYGGEMATTELAYYRFSLPFTIYHILYLISGKSWVLSILLWQFFWLITIFISAYYLYKLVIGHNSRLKILIPIGLLFLFFIRITDLKSIIHLWTHLPSLEHLPKLHLTFSRNFFPQTAMPYLFLYLIFLIRAFESHKWYYWALLAIIQLLTLMTFPYLVMLVAMITLITLLIFLGINKSKIQWKSILLFGMACILIDISYLIITGPSESASFQVPLIDVDFSKFYNTLGISKGILLLLTIVITFLKPKAGLTTKVVFISLGLGSLLTSSLHIFLSSTLQIDNHIYYFTNAIAAMMLFYIAANLLENVNITQGIRKYTVYLFSAMIIVTGFAAAHSHYMRYQHKNQNISEIETFFQSHKDLTNMSSQLLVITPAYLTTVIEPMSFALVHNFHILYHPNAHFLTSKKETKPNIHKLREALYLYFIGKDRDWVNKLWSESTNFTEQEKWTIPAFWFLLSDHNRKKFLKRQLNQMMYHFNLVYNKDPILYTILRPYKKILLIDFKKNPIFNKSRVEEYFEFEKKYESGNFEYYLYRNPNFIKDEHNE